MEAGTLSLGRRQPQGRSMPLSAMSKYLPLISPGSRKCGEHPGRASVLIEHGVIRAAVKVISEWRGASVRHKILLPRSCGRDMLRRSGGAAAE